MADREKVIKESEEAIDILAKAEEPTFLLDFVRCAFENALAMLKEQEAVMPRVTTVEQRCGNCNKVIEMDGWITCPWCGKPIAWSEWWNKNGGKAVKLG